MVAIELLGPLVLLLVLILVGVPVAYSMLISGMLGVWLVIGTERAIGIYATAPYSQTTHYVLSTIPLFILMAMFLKESGLTEDLFRMIQYWVGHIPGGLAVATTIANGFMAVLSGSSTATAATMASISYDEMSKYDYDERLIMGTVSAAGTFAIMLPPSLALILYGVLTENSIGNLFIGGILPGIITLFGYIFVIFIWIGFSDKEMAEVERYSWEKRTRSAKHIWPILLIISAVLGGIYSGVITVTEAAAVGATSAFVVGVVLYGVRLNEIKDALVESLRINAMIFLIIMAASIFGFYITLTGLTQELLTAIQASPFGPLAVLLLILLLYVALGTFMDQLAVLILTLPVTYPLLVENLGYGPIWFGIVIVKTIEIGLVTPPFGLNVYVASGAVDVSVDVGFRGAVRFLLVDFAVLGLLIAFPEIVTVLL